jgi:hypothetical protein
MRKHAPSRRADKIARKIKGGRWLDVFGRRPVPFTGDASIGQSTL